MLNTTVNGKFKIFIIGIRIKIAKFVVLNNSLITIFYVNIKRSKIFKF